MKVCFETFGCRLNKAEALQMEADYLAKGWEVTKKHADANLIVVRGCSVTSRAQRECERLIDHLKRHYPTTQLKILGCLSVAENAAEARARGNGVFAEGSPRRSFRATDANTPTRTARAYLKVQDGCAGKCTFCIVPKFRGESRSEDFTSLLDKAKRFIDAGYHEIVVTGCNLALYCSQGKRLPDLLSALADLTPSFDPQLATQNSQLSSCRIRLGSVEPGGCALETVRAMAEHPNVCRFLHLAVQSGSEDVLKAMRRSYSAKDVGEVATLAAKLMPDLGLGCDLMTGFPGETERDFFATKGLLKRLPFNNAHIFPYSKRPGTLAAAFPHQLPKDVRSARAHKLAEVIQSKRTDFAKSFIGKTVEIIVEDVKTGRGWTEEYLPCEPVVGAPQRKSLIRVFVTKVKDDTLFGRLGK